MSDEDDPHRFVLPDQLPDSEDLERARAFYLEILARWIRYMRDTVATEGGPGQEIHAAELLASLLGDLEAHGLARRGLLAWRHHAAAHVAHDGQRLRYDLEGLAGALAALWTGRPVAWGPPPS